MQLVGVNGIPYVFWSLCISWSFGEEQFPSPFALEWSSTLRILRLRRKCVRGDRFLCPVKTARVVVIQAPGGAAFSPQVGQELLEHLREVRRNCLELPKGRGLFFEETLYLWPSGSGSTASYWPATNTRCFGLKNPCRMFGFEPISLVCQGLMDHKSFGLVYPLEWVKGNNKGGAFLAFGQLTFLCRSGWMELTQPVQRRDPRPDAFPKYHCPQMWNKS